MRLVKSKKGDIGLSLETIIKLVIVSICLLLALYIGWSVYRLFSSAPDEGTLKTLYDFTTVMNEKPANEPQAIMFYSKDQDSFIAFDKGDDRTENYAGVNMYDEDGRGGPIFRPTAKTPPRGCGSEGRACICLCPTRFFAANNHCEEPIECRTAPDNIRAFLVKTSIDAEVKKENNIPGNFGEPAVLEDGTKLDGHHLVIFGDTALGTSFGTKTLYMTKKAVPNTNTPVMYDIYITQEKPLDSKLFQGGDSGGGGASGQY